MASILLSKQKVMVTSFVAITLFQALHSQHFQSHCDLEGWWMVRCRTDRGDIFGDTVQDGAKIECVTLTLFHCIIPRNESLMSGPNHCAMHSQSARIF